MYYRYDKGKNRLDNNRGVTFIELVVVVAILALMAAGATYGVSMLVNADAKKASKNLYQAVSELRNETLSQTGEWYGELKRESANGQYIFTILRKDSDGIKVKEEFQLGSKIRISVTGQGTTDITDASPIYIYFNPGSGTVKKVENDLGASLLNLTSIIFKFDIVSNNGNNQELTLWTNTGKISTDY